MATEVNGNMMDVLCRNMTVKDYSCVMILYTIPGDGAYDLFVSNGVGNITIQVNMFEKCKKIRTHLRQNWSFNIR